MPKAKTPKSAPAASQNTLVTFVLDRSGSMDQVKAATIEAFNAYAEGLKSDGEGILFSLVQFDTMGLDRTYVRTPIAKVTGLNNQNYAPRGGTPLIDAAFKTIKAVEGSLSEFSTAPKIIVCIQTDGEENASTEHTWASLNVLIKEKIAAGWQFNFLGCGIDAYQQGSKMGIAAMNTMSYDRNDAAKTRAAFTASARNTVEFSAGRLSSTAYSAVARSAAGDQFGSKYLGAPPSGAAVAVPASITTSFAPPLRKHSAPAPTQAIVDDFSL